MELCFNYRGCELIYCKAILYNCVIELIDLASTYILSMGRILKYRSTYLRVFIQTLTKVKSEFEKILLNLNYLSGHSYSSRDFVISKNNA